jgi:hypothetical protein
LGAVLLAAAGVMSVVSGAGVANAGVAPGLTTLISVKSDGSQTPAAVNASPHGVISGNGRYVAFSTSAVMDNGIGQSTVDGLNDSEGGDNDIYLRDRQTGRTFLASRSVLLVGYGEDLHYEVSPSNGGSLDPTISADGRFLAFESEATNLDNGGADNDTFVDVYFCDLDTDGNGEYADSDPFDVSCAVQSRRDKDANNTRNSYGYDPALSANGQTLAWQQTPFAGAKPPTPAYNGVVVTQPDFSEGVPAHPSDLLNLDLPLPNLDYRASGNPVVSADGRHVAVLGFYGEPVIIDFAATDPGDAHNATIEVNLGFALRDGVLRLAQESYIRVDVDANGAPLDADLCCIPYGITSDGGLVSFSGPPPGGGRQVAMVSGPGNVAGAEPKSRIVSIANDGTPGPASQPTLSSDGRYIAYQTTAPTMHDGVDNVTTTPCVEIGFTAAAAPANVRTCSDIVVRDLVVDNDRRNHNFPPLVAVLASPGTSTNCVAALPAGESCEGDDDSDEPSLSDTGIVAYSSDADDLVSGDGNKRPDMFIREFRPELAGDPVDFGVVDLGDTGTQTATVRHIGFGPLGVESVTLDSPDGPDGNDEFVIVTDGCATRTMNQADTCGISIQYTPTSEGERHATLTIKPAGRDPITIDITGGVGVPPDGFTARPDPLNFGQRLALSPSGPKVLTVTNNGRVPLGVRDVTLPVGGKIFGKDYKITQNTCTNKNLPVGGSCTIAVSFTSHGAGQRPAALQIMTVQQGVTAQSAHVIGLRGVTPTPAILVNPGVVVNGRVTNISGTNFAQNAEVLLTIGDQEPVKARTDAAGNFDQAVLVLPHSPLTSRPVDATVATTTLKVTTTFLVVAGSFQAPDFSSRR